MKVVSLYHNFRNRGGAQNVALQIAHYFCERPIVMTNTPINLIDKYYADKNIEFTSFSLKKIFKNRNSIFISHSRKQTTVLCLLNKLGFDLKVIHVAHNLFYNKKHLTLFPKHIIAVSYSVKDNLVDYFRVSPTSIEVIYNGEKDYFNSNLQVNKDNITRIIIAARICPVKRQVALIKSIKGKVPNDIQFCFAGNGEDLEELLTIIDNDPHFSYEGQIDMFDALYGFDYVCLFSEKEGLPLSLIEGCMFSKPLITNAIKPCLEVNRSGKNGLVFDTFEDLICGLPDIPRRNSQEYRELSICSRKIYEEYFTEEMMLNNYFDYIKRSGLL